MIPKDNTSHKSNEIISTNKPHQKPVIDAKTIQYIVGEHATPNAFKHYVLKDYYLMNLSRQISLLGRREVLNGKAKFGILGDGKELPQIALSKVFRNGDHRSGYYRDQTWMLAAGLLSPEQFFAQLYADNDPEREPHSQGRQMNAHFATPTVDKEGNWLSQMDQKNSSSDISSTGGQMSRAVGLAMASKVYRYGQLPNEDNFSHKGEEIAFVTIGDASTSEGVFWESMNAAGVLRIPMFVSVWDDGYGISVPTKYQTTKGSISAALAGFHSDDPEEGIHIREVYAWDYVGLCKAYRELAEHTRKTHQPVLLHVKECTQPQGHSTSGSHERYKTKERLAWEKENDCIAKMTQWIIDAEISTAEELKELQESAKKRAREAMKAAWKAFNQPIQNNKQELINIYDNIISELQDPSAIVEAKDALSKTLNPTYRDLSISVRRTLLRLRHQTSVGKLKLIQWRNEFEARLNQVYSHSLYADDAKSALKVQAEAAKYDSQPEVLNGYEILNRCFDALLERDPRVIAFGEDVGQIGDVNQGFANLQLKHGLSRVFDTGIRENTIMGQGMGLAMRGIRPIAEIQYLDYFIYGLQQLTDDLATLTYRSAGQQKAPLIVRTRGHRLEGIWHAGSPISMLISSLRGIHILVPRNMVQAAGFYNTLMAADDPGIVIECLNGYRLKEKLPSNIGTFKLPLGQVETIREGDDITIVTYGSCCRIAMEAAELLSEEADIECEIIDVQSLLPFDLNKETVNSIKKTNRLLVFDEDVPGGASAYILQNLLEEQNAYFHLDAKPETLTAKAHRCAFGSDGDHWSKPNTEDVIERVYKILHEADPASYPTYY